MRHTRLVRIVPLWWVLVLLSEAASLEAAELKPETVRAWTAYVEATERRIAAEFDAGGDRFLLLDFHSPARASEERNAVLAGQIPIVEMDTRDAGGENFEVPSGMIHHWRGAVFLPGVRLEDVMRGVVYPTDADFRQEDVLEAAVLDRGPDWLTVYLKLQRGGIVTVVYNTEHRVRFRRHGGGRASSSSVSTRIAELENPNSARERERPPGHDRGFLWRLNSYWRYQEVEGGVIVECESLSLSRDVPFLLARIIGPLIDGVARDSLERTLATKRDRHAASPAEEGTPTGHRRLGLGTGR